MALARIQRRILLFCLLFLLVCAAVALWMGSGRWFFGGFLLLAVAYTSTLGIEFLLLYRSYSGCESCRPSIPQLTAAYMQEMPCALAAFLWRQPFASETIPDRVRGVQPGRGGMVLVHGLFCNRGFWNPWLRQLQALGIPFVAIDLEPLFGSIDAYVSQIDSAVEQLSVASGGVPPILVGHSMGGLAIRAWLVAGARANAAQHVVTIGTPHDGTLIARYSLLTNGKEMRRGSNWLTDLRKSESGGRRAPFTCFWSYCDNIVFPTDSATLPGADNRNLTGMPHMAMAFHPAVFAEALCLLETR